MQKRTFSPDTLRRFSELEQKLGYRFNDISLLATALTQAAVPYKLSIYPYGPHGIALSTDVTRCGRDDFVQPLAAGWTSEADEWMKTV